MSHEVVKRLLPVMNYNQNDIIDTAKKNFTPVALIAVGALFSSSFAAGASLVALPAIALYGAKRLLDSSRVQDKNYAECCADLRAEGQYEGEDPVDAYKKGVFFQNNVFTPFMTEVTLRWAAQGIFCWASRLILPAVAINVFGTPIALATITGVALTALLAIDGELSITSLRNTAHASNWQRLVNFVQNVALGAIKVNLGLPAAIAAHMVNNTVSTTLARRFSVA